MSEKLLVMLTLGILVVLLPFQTGCFATHKVPVSPGQQEVSTDEQGGEMIWGEPYVKDDTMVIPGSVQASFGEFKVRWVIYPDQSDRLITSSSLMAGEGPPVEVKLHLLGRKDGTTVLFQQWATLVGDPKPSGIRPVIVVKTNQLFSVLDGVDGIPVKNYDKQPQDISWGDIFEKKGSQYVPGSIKADFGSANICWKREVDGTLRLITTEALGGGELPLREVPLYIWNDNTAKTTLLCQERKPILNQPGPAYLWPLVVVKTTELIEGMNRLGD